MQAGPLAEKEMLAAGAHIAHFRDDFYRDGFRVVLLSFGMTLTAIGLLIMISLYFFLHQVLPITFPVYDGFRVQPDIPVNRPYLHTADLLAWVDSVLPVVLAVDFMNYNNELKEAAPYFTDNGLEKFAMFTKTYMNYEDVLKNKVFIQASPLGAPVVLNQGLVDGKYAWWVQMPMDVLYSGAEGNNHNSKLIIQVLIVRVPTLNNLDGVAIENLIAKQG